MGDLTCKQSVSHIWTLYEGTMMPEGFQHIAENILNMDVREDDTFLCGFPKSGTTWSQELVWCIANDLDFQKAKVSQCIRFPLLEFELFTTKSPRNIENSALDIDPRIFTHSLDYVKGMESPRFIKTHLPFHLLPLKLQRGEVMAKIITVTRDPMDTCISYYHYMRNVFGYTGSLEDYASLFINDAVVYSPFWLHRQGYLEKKNKFNILHLKYEEMKEDLPSVVRKTSIFLNKELNEEQVDKLCSHLSFTSMRNNPATNREDYLRTIRKLNVTSTGESEWGFMREGTVGQWKSAFGHEWVERFQKWTEANVNALCKPDTAGIIYKSSF